MINVLMNSGRPISTATADLLYSTAKVMFRKGRKSTKFNNDECAGILRCSGKHGSIGSVSGLEFKAEMLLRGKETVVTFIVGHNWLEDHDVDGWECYSSLNDAEMAIAEAERAEGPPASKLN